ncbi:MAG: hypothetical protein IKJ86_05660 [Clostridia bacterium]|nr:hypothetical protein [Clostridia bacterium]
MNFGKAKKILIFLFLFINIFLIAQLFLQPDRYTLEKKAMQDTMQIANKNGVSFSEDVIPSSYNKIEYLNLYNPLADKQAFSKQFKNASFNKDGTFTLSKVYDLKDESKDTVLTVLNENGFENYNLIYVNHIKNPVTDEKMFTFSQNYNSLLINGAEIRVYVNNNKISKITGNLYTIKGANETDSALLSPLQCIIEFSNLIKLNNKKVTLSKIEQSYYIPADAKNYKDITAAPCYVLTVNQNKFYYDAYHNTFIYMITKDRVHIDDQNKAFQLL